VPAVTNKPTRGSAATVLTAAAIMLVAANLRPAVVAVAPIIDDIRATTGWDSSAAGLLTTLPVLMFGLTAPVAPRIAARFGIERTVLGCMVLLTAAIALRLYPHAAALLAGSALIGMAVGVCNVVLPALIKRDFAHRSGLMTGLYSMTLSAGAAVAAAVAVPLTEAVGGHWREGLALWAVVAALTTIGWIPMLRQVHRPRARAKAQPLWRNPIALAITAFMATQSCIFYTFGAWLPQVLIERGMSPAEAGAVLAVGQIAGLLMSLIAPIIASRFADQRILTMAMVVLCAAGFAGLITTDRFPVLWTALIVAGPGAAIGLVLLFMVLRSSSTAQTTQVSGMAQSAGYILAAAGPVAIGALHDATGSWTVAMTALALLLIPQAVATLWAAKNATMT